MTRVDEVIVLGDHATGLQTGTVCEPSLGASSTKLLVTGNWFASASLDDGATWTLTDPFTCFPADRGRFCCDQLSEYLVKEGRWVWLLQYEAIAGENILRLAVSKRSAPQGWHWWDVAPSDLDPTWTGLWLDYPDLTYSDEHLYVSVNLFDASDRWHRAVVMRWPRSELTRAASVRRQHWSTTKAGSLRFVHGAADTMWFAATDVSRHRLQLFAWPDDEAGVHEFDRQVSGWNATTYTSLGPTGEPWLARVDDRITGGWRAGGQIGFCWTSGANGARPHPFVRAAAFEEASLDLVGEPDLWSDNGAWAYPATAVNRRGQVGMSVTYGGPSHPAHAVGVLDQAEQRWITALSGVSTHAPRGGVWGDYLTCRPHPRRPTAWRAVGYLLDGGNDRRFIEPRIVTFTG